MVYLCRRSSHLKIAHINHCKNNYRLEIINPIHSNNLSLSYHSSAFFIFPLSEAVFLSSFGGMSECNIFGIVFNTQTHSLLLKFIIAIYMYVLLCKT